MLRGESYAAATSADLHTFKVIVFDETGHITRDLAYQIYDDAIRAVLTTKGYREDDVAPDLLVAISASSDSTSVASERTVPTATLIPGSTSQIRSTSYTPLGPVNGTSTITTNSQLAFGQRTVSETTTYQRGRIDITAYDQRFYNAHDELGDNPERSRQAWVMRFAYSYELPISIPKQTFVPKILKLTSDKLGVQAGEWIRTTTLDELSRL